MGKGSTWKLSGAGYGGSVETLVALCQVSKMAKPLQYAGVALDRANALRRELAQGGDFAAAAAEHSVDEKTSRIGGSLGYFSVDDNPELWEISQGLTIGKLSKPVASDDGFFHIVRVLERVEAGSVKSLEQVRAEIVETLVRADYRRRLDGLIERLKEQKTVMVDDERLSRL